VYILQVPIVSLGAEFVHVANMPHSFVIFLTCVGTYTSVFASARRKVVLLKDLRNTLHPAVHTRFHDALRGHVEHVSDVAHVVLVISDASVCAEGNSSSGSRGCDVVVDACMVVLLGLLSLSHFSEIRSVRLCDFALFLMGADRCAIDSIRSRLCYSLWRLSI
jgi:hypothetical protein